VLRWLFHEKQSLSDPEDLLIPFLITNPSGPAFHRLDQPR
jgi:hypothetical protein